MNNFLTSLFKYLNHAEVKDNFYQIALFIVTNHPNLRLMTLKDFSEESLVPISAINRFMRIYGYDKYAIFKAMVFQHVEVRKMQLKSRLINHENEKNYQAVMSSAFDFDFNQEDFKKQCMKWCEEIRGGNRIFIMGSDELIGRCLGVQADFSVMGKALLGNSIFEKQFNRMNEGDVAIVLSMQGRVLGISNQIFEEMSNKGIKIMTIGVENTLVDLKHQFIIPEKADEILKLMLFDIYMKQLASTYWRMYYAD